MTDAVAASSVGQAIGVALLQFLWQGAVIGGLSGVALVLLRHTSAHVRYLSACVGLAVMLIVPVATAYRAYWAPQMPRVAFTTHARAGFESASAARTFADAATAGATERPVPASRFSWAAAPRLLNRYLPAIVLIWAAGVLILSLHLLVTWLLVERLRRRSGRPSAEVWRDRATAMASTLRISRPIQMVESAFVAVPTVIGWIRPIVLVPVSALAGLSPSQLEAVIAHELAHIKRHDYLVNLLQSLVETLLFFHPAVWWLSGRIRIEREHCCDDIAIDICGDRLAYADALTSLAELQTSTPALVMAGTGGRLADRIRRVLGLPLQPTPRTSSWLIAGVTAVVLSVTVLSGVLPGVRAAEQTRSVPPQVTEVDRALAELQSRRATTNTIQVTRAVEPASAGQPIPAPSRIPDVLRRDDGTDAPSESFQTPPMSSDEAQIRDLEDRHRLAKLRNDVGALAAVLDDAYVGVNQSGNRRNKPQALELWRDFHITSLVIDSMNVQVSRDAAIVTGATTEVNVTGTDQMLFTRVWKRDAGGNWRLLSNSQFRDPRAPTGAAFASTVSAPIAVGFVTESATGISTHSLAGVPPQKIRDVAPVYPPVALAAKVEGFVVLEIVIDQQGNVSDAKIVRHVPLLDQAAIDAVRQWKFQPLMVNGTPVLVKSNVTVTFTLPR